MGAMTLIAIDTTTAWCAVALARRSNGALALVAQASERIGRGHAERLMPMVTQVLGEAGITYGDLRRIAVTTGPGSFTGLRVGLAAARGFGLALQIDTVGISVLDALCRQARALGTRLPVAAAIDAKNGEVYGQIMTGTGRLSSRAALMGIAPFVELLPAAPVIVIGSAAAALAEAAGPLGKSVKDALVVEAAEIETVAALGAEADPRVAPAKPLYLRPPDAKPQIHKRIARQ